MNTAPLKLFKLLEEPQKALKDSQLGFERHFLYRGGLFVSK